VNRLKAVHRADHARERAYGQAELLLAGLLDVLGVGVAGIRLRQLGWPPAVTEALEAAGKGYEERELTRLRGDLHRWASESLFPTAD